MPDNNNQNIPGVPSGNSILDSQLTREFNLRKEAWLIGGGTEESFLVEWKRLRQEESVKFAKLREEMGRNTQWANLLHQF